MTKELPTIEELHRLLIYNPETGALTWRTRPNDRRSFNQRLAGQPALACVNFEGYLHGVIHGNGFRAHRVAWAMHHGQWPTAEIDHINGNRADNRMSNLREATSAENSRNMRMMARNKSGVTGVFWHKSRRRWIAEIKGADSKPIHIGNFVIFQDAVDARKQAEREHGYHENHGARPQGFAKMHDDKGSETQG
jgi:hypothetical protein